MGREEGVDRIILSIDPGTHSTGYCFVVTSDPFRIREIGVMEAKSGNWKNNCDLIMGQLNEKILAICPYMSVLEFPEYWGGPVGYSARESGSTSKLSFLCGRIYEKLSLYVPDFVNLITPSQWKGQLSKELIAKRLAKIYPELDFGKLNHNAIDALGIAHYSIKKGLIHVD